MFFPAFPKLCSCVVWENINSSISHVSWSIFIHSGRAAESLCNCFIVIALSVLFLEPSWHVFQKSVTKMNLWADYWAYLCYHINQWEETTGQNQSTLSPTLAITGFLFGGGVWSIKAFLQMNYFHVHVRCWSSSVSFLCVFHLLRSHAHAVSLVCVSFSEMLHFLDPPVARNPIFWSKFWNMV